MAVNGRRVQSNRRCGARRSSLEILSLDKGLDKGSELVAVPVLKHPIQPTILYGLHIYHAGNCTKGRDRL
jgi:hypothetical protein